MKKHFFFLFIFTCFRLFPQLFINEIMPNNVSVMMDEGYNYSMWVELYNAGTAVCNQNEYYFSDDRTNPGKWNPASKLIPAGGYSVLWFEREDRKQHAGFKLNPEGGRLFLFDRSGMVVDSVFYPSQHRNVSYGRRSDGDGDWVFFEEYTPGASNAGKKWGLRRCADPVFSRPGGFYSGPVEVEFAASGADETIYYTLDGSEPVRENARIYTSGQAIRLSETTAVRAKSYSEDKLPSNVATMTYFIDERDHKLPVVSVVTDERYLTDDMIGIYVVGRNGTSGVATGIANFNQDWDRPANFELYGKSGEPCLNQELDIAISGGWSRSQPQKSLKISPKKKFGSNRLEYDLFRATKPDRKYKDIQLRNSGNDFKYSMMRDAFAQSIVINRLNVDCQAYEPAVCYMNGEYYGIQNLRERTSKDYLYSNYGLSEDEFISLTNQEIQFHPDFLSLTVFLRDNDVTDPAVYEQVCGMMDVDSYIDYMIAEMYYANSDWPQNNFKVWKKKDGGRWRWILYDTDSGFNINSGGTYSINSFEYVFEKTALWTVYPIRRLMTNETFKNKFVDRLCIHMSSTFRTERVDHIMDSIASKIEHEIVFHKDKWGSSRSFEEDIERMKSFSKYRPGVMLEDLSERFFQSAPFCTFSLTSNIDNAAFKFNEDKILDGAIELRYIQGREVRVEAYTHPTHTFKHWELTLPGSTDVQRYDEPVFTAVLASDIQLRAVFEAGDDREPADVVINEVLAGNTMIKDNFSETDDYIELYNRGEREVNIAGWYISDNVEDEMLFRIPETDIMQTIIPAKGRIIVWADGKPGQGVLHTNFELNKAGESVVLSRPTSSGELRTVDRVDFPALLNDMSYSRVPDGGESWSVQPPTFDKPNGGKSALKQPKPETAIALYPTVVTDYVVIEQAAGSDVRVIDLAGHQMLRYHCLSDREELVLEGLDKGVYMIQVGEKAFKVVKI